MASRAEAVDWLLDVADELGDRARIADADALLRAVLIAVQTATIAGVEVMQE